MLMLTWTIQYNVVKRGLAMARITSKPLNVRRSNTWCGIMISPPSTEDDMLFGQFGSQEGLTCGCYRHIMLVYGAHACFKILSHEERPCTAPYCSRNATADVAYTK